MSAIDQMLRLATCDPFAGAAEVLTEDEAKAKKLLKQKAKHPKDSDEARGFRAYLRAKLSDRDATYLFKLKGPESKGAKAAA